MTQGNVHFQQRHAWGYFAFKHFLRSSDDGSLPLVEKICDLMGFRAANRLRVDKVQTASCFSVLPLLPIMKRVTGKTTKLTNSHQKPQEYIQSKSLLFILWKNK